MMNSLRELMSQLARYQNQEIGEARALPLPHYTSPELFDREREALF